MDELKADRPTGGIMAEKDIQGAAMDLDYLV